MINSSDRWLIVGLGNPGPQYEQTRHNVGFMVIHHLARQFSILAKPEPKFKALVGSGRIENPSDTQQSVPVILAQPLTYMNLSGEAVSKLTQYYDIPLSRLLVAYDDAALPFGKIRLRSGGSAGGQNGMKSIIQSLGGQDAFPRLRIGIGAPTIDMTHHVLSRFKPQEQTLLEKVLDTSVEAIKAVLFSGLPHAMSQFNGISIQ